MSETNLDNLSIAELNKRKAEASDDDFGTDRRGVIEDERKRREEERAELHNLLAMKNQLSLAKDRGLADDPTVHALEAHVDEFDAALHPDPRRELAQETGIDKERVEGLSDAEAEQVREHVEAVDLLAGSSSTAARVSLEGHIDALEELLADHDVEIDALVESAGVDKPGVSIATLFEDEDD